MLALQTLRIQTTTKLLLNNPVEQQLKSEDQQEIGVHILWSGCKYYLQEKDTQHQLGTVVEL